MVYKILFITLSNIGDCILTLPSLEALKRAFPQSQITVMVGPRPKDIFQDNPYIARVIVYDKLLRLREKIKLFNELKKERFDAVIDLRNSFFGVFLPAKIRTSPFLTIPKNITHMKNRHLYKVQDAIHKLQNQPIRLPQLKSQGLLGVDTERRLTPSKYQILPKATPLSLSTPLESPVPLQKDFVTGPLPQEESFLTGFTPLETIEQSVRRKMFLTGFTRPKDEQYIKKILKENDIKEEDRIVVISAGARSQIKRWAPDKFVELLAPLIKEFGLKVILVGDKDDIAINKYITEHAGFSLLDLSAKTTLTEALSLLKKAKLLITNDSAVMHIGSYINIPVVAIFGPTHEQKYGPWSMVCSVVKKDIACRPCQKAQCKFGTLDCMRLIKVEDVLRQVRDVLVVSSQLPVARQREDFKRILIVRTDRIGDVLLSTPVIKALRNVYPSAYIAMMVSPYAKEVVEGNPYLDEVIIYDKNNRHKTLRQSFRFSFFLKQKNFDLALVLHPTNRAHLVTYVAAIPRRIGYDRKLGFLLTDKIRHTKQLGKKHELEYTLDLIRYLGIQPQDTSLFMPIKPESEKWVENLFREVGINESDKLLSIHPGASCPSKIWPAERFAQVADRLAEKYGFKVLMVSGPKDIAGARSVSQHMQHPVVNLAGKTSISQLASLLKRCYLFISNDSGPVHIGSSVGVPVISIFGRNQKGLSPLRWGPTGKSDKLLHKEVGCMECLAHNCKKEFACLKAISVEDVLNIVDSIMNL